MDEPLPPGWEQQVDAGSGAVYFYNAALHESVWTAEEARQRLSQGSAAADDATAAVAASPRVDGAGSESSDAWQRVVDPETQQAFFYNPRRRLSAWSVPAGAATAAAAASAAAATTGAATGSDAAAEAEEGWFTELEQLVAECPDALLNRVVVHWSPAKVVRLARGWTGERAAAVMAGWDAERIAAVCAAGLPVDLATACLTAWPFEASLEVLAACDPDTLLPLLTSVYADEAQWSAIRVAAVLERLPGEVAGPLLNFWGAEEVARVLRLWGEPTQGRALAAMDATRRHLALSCMRELAEAGYCEVPDGAMGRAEDGEEGGDEVEDDDWAPRGGSFMLGSPGAAAAGAGLSHRSASFGPGSEAWMQARRGRGPPPGGVAVMGQAGLMQSLQTRLSQMQASS